jgi:hypothetical protein
MRDRAEAYDLPDFLHELFCGPSPMHGEDAEVYAVLRAQVADVVQPKDVFDQMMVADVTNHFWEQQRIRRCTGTVIDTARLQALQEILTPMLGYRHDAQRLAALYFGAGEDALRGREQVVQLLRRHGLDETAIDTQATRISVPTLCSFEDLILRHEVRREAIVREIARRRAARAPRPRTGDAPADGNELPQPPAEAGA